MEWVRDTCIGKGSFGTISLAYRKSDGESFAVKSVILDSSCHPLAVSSLEKEIEILQSLDSPYIVTYLGDSTTQESSGMWRNLHMECLPGGTIAELATKSTMDEANIQSYTRCIVQALRYLHSVAGVVHSDVKGRNVLVGPVRGTAKLADFGSSRRIETTANVHEVIGGTPLWMAPEMARGKPATPESDIWCLGCTVIEMATGGGHPWRKQYDSGLDDQHQIMFHVGYGAELPEFPPRLSKQARDFLDKCLRRDASERWTAEQLLQHPFLDSVNVADIDGDNTRPSPRSVLDRWGNSELFDDSFDDEEEVVTDNGRERIRELASRGAEMVEWNWNVGNGDDGWEVVRTSCSEEEEEQRKCVEYSDNCDGELEDCDNDDDDDNKASGSGLSNRMTCCSSCACCCCSCHCCCGSYCCKIGLCCQRLWSLSSCCKICTLCFVVANRLSCCFSLIFLLLHCYIDEYVQAMKLDWSIFFYFGPGDSTQLESRLFLIVQSSPHVITG